MSRQAGIPQKLIHNAFTSIHNYFKFNERLENMLDTSIGIDYFDQVSLLLLANKILIYGNILQKQRLIKNKINHSKSQLISFSEVQILNTIQENGLDVAIMGACKKTKISQKQHFKFKELCQFIEFLEQKKQIFFKKNQLLKYQFYLRKFIAKFIHDKQIVIKEWNQQSLSISQKQLVVLDFLVSILQLNALLLQTNNDWARFGKISQIQKATDYPIKINKQAFKSMLNKINVLRLSQHKDK